MNTEYSNPYPCVKRGYTVHNGDMDTSLGRYVREWRERRNMTQSDLAEPVGIGRSHLSQIESGKIKFPNAGIRRRLAAAMGISHVELLIAADELTRDELGTAAPEFPPGSAQERIVELVRQLPDDLAARLVTDAETLIEVDQYRRQVARYRSANEGGVAAAG